MSVVEGDISIIYRVFLQFMSNIYFLFIQYFIQQAKQIQNPDEIKMDFIEILR